MKLILITSLLFLITMGNTFCQSIRPLLKKEQAYRSAQFNILQLPANGDMLGNPEYERMSYSPEEAFIYTNIPDSIIVIYLYSKGNNFKISERFKLTQVEHKSPLVISLINDDSEKLVLRLVEDNGIKFQFYYPERQVDIKGKKMMMAYEFEDVHLLGQTPKH